MYVNPHSSWDWANWCRAAWSSLWILDFVQELEGLHQLDQDLEKLGQLVEEPLALKPRLLVGDAWVVSLFCLVLFLMNRWCVNGEFQAWEVWCFTGDLAISKRQLLMSPHAWKSGRWCWAMIWGQCPASLVTISQGVPQGCCIVIVGKPPSRLERLRAASCSWVVTCFFAALSFLGLGGLWQMLSFRDLEMGENLVAPSLGK